MQYTQSMNLQSPSGYAMPFELNENVPLEIVCGYGKQFNPHNKQEYFSHGIDFKVRPGTWLKALASGIVSGIASDMHKGFYITINYRNYCDGEQSFYDVTYSHIRESLCSFGKNVRASDNVAVCDGMLHIEVKFNGEEIDPMEFLTMLRDNVMITSQMNMEGSNPEIATLDLDIHTKYDAQEDEIFSLQNKFLKNYFVDMMLGRYHVPKETDMGIRNALIGGINNGALYEHAPSNFNPAGLGRRSTGMLSTLFELLVEDFLNYLALKHSIFLSTMSEDEKKKLLTGH